MANKITYKTEDEIRDGAKIILGFDQIQSKVKQGTGQITTFNQLGFKGINDKPDGWYLPDDHNSPAIILETKSILVIMILRPDLQMQKTSRSVCARVVCAAGRTNSR